MTETAFLPQAWAGLSPQYERKPFSCELAGLTGMRVEHEETTNCTLLSFHQTYTLHSQHCPSSFMENFGVSETLSCS